MKFEGKRIRLLEIGSGDAFHSDPTYNEVNLIGKIGYITCTSTDKRFNKNNPSSKYTACHIKFASPLLRKVHPLSFIKVKVRRLPEPKRRTKRGSAK